MKVWGVTDIGSVRKENQDTFAVCRMDQPRYCVAVVCDGMGGARGGQTASQMAVDVYLEHMEENLMTAETTQQVCEASAAAVEAANAAIYAQGCQNENLRGMGTTLISAVSCQEGVVVTNVGDSRAYYLNDEGLCQISRDHSVVEELLELGDITREEARRHPNRNLITRALGPDSSITCDHFIQPMQPGDMVMLCSDGLVDVLTDDEILAAARQAQAPDQIPQRLLDAVMQRGAGDNVTIVLLQKA